MEEGAILQLIKTGIGVVGTIGPLALAEILRLKHFNELSGDVQGNITYLSGQAVAISDAVITEVDQWLVQNGYDPLPEEPGLTGASSPKT